MDLISRALGRGVCLCAQLMCQFVICGPRVRAFLANGRCILLTPAQWLWFHHRHVPLLSFGHSRFNRFRMPTWFCGEWRCVFVGVYGSLVNHLPCEPLVYRETLLLAMMFINSQSAFTIGSAVCTCPLLCWWWLPWYSYRDGTCSTTL